MALNRLAIECIGALDGIRVLLLKGPILETLLYPDGGRTWNDVDLLVDPGRQPEAINLLRSIEVTLTATYVLPGDHARYGQHGPTGMFVDLHHRLPGVGLDPRAAFEVLWQNRATYLVASRDVNGPDPAGAAMHLCLHAAHDGRNGVKALEDLRRGLAQLDVWEEALALAQALHAVDPMVAGLRLLPEGIELADALALPDISSSVDRARSGGAPQPVITALSLLEARGPDRLSILRRLLAPHPDLLRDKWRIAGRGPIGLALAYPLRWADLFLRAARSGPAILRIRRGTRGAVREPGDLAEAGGTGSLGAVQPGVEGQSSAIGGHADDDVGDAPPT